MGRQSLFAESPLGIPGPNAGWGHPEDTALTACAPRVSLVPGERMRTEPQSSEAAAFSLELEGHALGALPDTPLTGCKSDLVHLALYESLPHSAP